MTAASQEKFLIVAPSWEGPRVYGFYSLDGMAAVLMSWCITACGPIEGGSAWKKQGNSWVPCWPWQMHKGNMQ